LPNVSGRSRHGAPVRQIQRIPSSKDSSRKLPLGATSDQKKPLESLFAHRVLHRTSQRTAAYRHPI
jgi:hypothetical protein